MNKTNILQKILVVMSFTFLVVLMSPAKEASGWYYIQSNRY